MTEENRSREEESLTEAPAPEFNEDPITEDPEAPVGEIDLEELVSKSGPVKEEKKVSLFNAVIAAVITALCTFMVTYILASAANIKVINKIREDTGGIPKDAYAKIAEIAKILEKDGLYDIDEDALADMVLKGYMYGLGDDYAEYYTKEEYDALMSDTNAEMQGIGIQISMNAETSSLQVTGIFPESPASRAGLKVGDLINAVKVNGEYVSIAEIGQTAALEHLRGKEGTFAEFTVLRDGETVEFSVKREKITEYTVTHRVYSLDESIGIITITSFDKKTPEQFSEAYDALMKKGVTKLILDVRNNPGGELISVCSVLDMIVPEGPVVRSINKAGETQVLYNSAPDEINIPMAVLVNGNTASAGELLTACLKDYDKARIVGTTTFGKGIMQTVVSFPDGTAFKYTNRYYCAPFSENYHGVGIQPHVTVELPEEVAEHFYTMTDEEDTQLKAAVKELNK